MEIYFYDMGEDYKDYTVTSLLFFILLLPALCICNTEWVQRPPTYSDAAIDTSEAHFDETLEPRLVAFSLGLIGFHESWETALWIQLVGLPCELRTCALLLQFSHVGRKNWILLIIEPLTARACHGNCSPPAPSL